MHTDVSVNFKHSLVTHHNESNSRPSTTGGQLTDKWQRTSDNVVVFIQRWSSMSAWNTYKYQFAGITRPLDRQNFDSFSSFLGVFVKTAKRCAFWTLLQEAESIRRPATPYKPRNMYQSRVSVNRCRRQLFDGLPSEIDFKHCRKRYKFDIEPPLSFSSVDRGNVNCIFWLKNLIIRRHQWY